MKQNRRTFLKYSSQTALALGLLGFSACGSDGDGEGHAHEHGEEGHIHDHDHESGHDHDHGHGTGELFFKISLAQWSLHKMLFAKEMDNLDFASMAKTKFEIDGIEYVNQFFKDKAEDQAYLAEMKKRADDNGVSSLIIMVDGEGNLGDPDDAVRKTAVENHYKWLEAAKFLGCHSIRVNAFGEGSFAEVGRAAVDGLGMLAEKAATMDMNVLVENHGSYSSNGKWLSGVMTNANMPNLGTLPDFGNFCTKRSGPGFWEGDCTEEYDRYKGVTEIMPFAKAVSAKSMNFDNLGNEVDTDYTKMMKIVKDAGYTGWVGIEYSGSKLTEPEGIMATKILLEKVGRELS